MCLPRNSGLGMMEYLSKLLLSVVCVSVSHPEGLIETVVLVLVRKSPFLWMEGYNLSATQHTTGNSSNSTIQPPLKDKYCISTVHMATQGISALFSKHFKNRQRSNTHTHTLECVHLHDFQMKDKQFRPTNMFISHISTQANLHTYAPCKGLTRKTLN